MFDIILKNGMVIDGTGKPWFRGDVAVADGRIAAVGQVEGKAERVIDIDGLAAAPGFIDIHTHSDLAILANRRAESKIRQGVTTEVVGNCGNSPAPLAGEAVEEYAREAAAVGVELTWRSLGEYLDAVDAGGTAVNIAALIGHGTVRKSVVGYGDREATGREMETMQATVAAAMAEGAFGMSTGLIYPPGCFTKTAEIAALCTTVHAWGGYYASHIRNEGAQLLEAGREFIEIGERSGVALEWSHIKAAGPAAWGKADELLEMLAAARQRGLEITADLYPYEATATGMAMFLPDWAHGGGQAAMVRRLRDPAEREKIRAAVTEKILSRGGWDKVVVAAVGSEKNKELAGLSLRQIAVRQQKEPADVVIDLLAEEEGAVDIISFAMREEDIRRLMRYPAVMFGSDGSCLAPYGPLDNGKPHPRNYGTFPRALGKYAREEKVITLEDAVRKMTALPARRLGLRDRGMLRPGMGADVAVFDPDTVKDAATYTEPKQYPVGMRYVLVNGRVAIEQGDHTGVLAGRALRHRRA